MPWVCVILPSVTVASPLAIVIVLLSAAAGAALTTAVSAAIWFAAAAVVGTEILIGVRAELTGRELVRQSAVGALLGLLVIAVRVLLH